MERILLFIITASGLCSFFSNSARQYHFVYELKNWNDALSYCRKKYTDLASIQSMEDVTILANLNKMIYLSYPYEVWIGLYDDVNSWRWSMSDRGFYKNSEADFRNWEPGQPDNKGSKEHCTKLNESGLWNDENCNNTHNAVCSDVNELNVTFVFINNSMTWTEAQSYCRAHHTDLASVRNMSENQKVQKLVPAGQTVWIGLFRDSWKWTDGSNYSFSYWNPSEPNNVAGNENCVSANFGTSGKWEDWPCDVNRPFVCYSVPDYKQVVRMRLEKITNLDLNDPAVMEAMLKQVKQKLEDQGVKGDIKVSWRKQPDGEVFHEDQKGTQKDRLLK